MKKIISIFLATAMIICVMPSSVMATDDSAAASCIVAKTVASEKNTLTVSWEECDGASEYVVYANKCNTKGHKYSLKKIATTEGASYTIKKIAGKKLAKHTFYRVKVVALDANGDSLTSSKMMYAATNGYKGKYGNTTKITAKTATVDVKVGETTTVGIETYKVYKDKKAATNYAAKLRYLSSNKSVATVDAKGVVTGVKEGLCTIYMQAPNGRWATTQVVVLQNEEAVDPKVINIDEKRAMMECYILPWDSSEKEHYYLDSEDPADSEIPSMGKKCSLKVGSDYYLYNDIDQAWIDANTTYKNKGNIVLTLYDDWVADENGSFGTDTSSFLDGGILIKGWEKNVTIDLNGFKIDRNLSGETITNGFVIKVDGVYDKKVYIENGYITGGGNTNDGGGVLIYGKAEVFFDTVTVTGNVSGRDGGGVYFGSYATVNLEDTSIEGNYAENYGGGAYADYNRDGADTNINEIKGVVTIQNNKGVNNRNNLTFEFSEGSALSSPYIEYARDLEEGSAVYVSCSQVRDAKRVIVYDMKYDTKTHKYLYLDGDEWEFVNINEILVVNHLGIVKSGC